MRNALSLKAKESRKLRDDVATFKGVTAKRLLKRRLHVFRLPLHHRVRVTSLHHLKLTLPELMDRTQLPLRFPQFARQEAHLSPIELSLQTMDVSLPSLPLSFLLPPGQILHKSIPRTFD